MQYTFTGDKINFPDQVSLITLWPDKDWFSQQSSSVKSSSTNLDLNGFSLVNLLSYGNFKALLTGDAGSNVEDKISTSVGKVSILKVPHHGSKTGMSDYFLSHIQLQLAVISVGAKNMYGHPSQLALNLLTKYHIKIL